MAVEFTPSFCHDTSVIRSLKNGRLLTYAVVLIVLSLLLVSKVLAAPAEFVFRLADNGENPFARQIWGEVELPSGRLVSLPAFYIGDGRYAVRARADAKGTYRLERILEENGNGRTVLRPGDLEKKVKIAKPDPVLAVQIDTRNPRAFSLSNGVRFAPLGINLAWPHSDTVPYYEQAFGKMSRAGLNWVRIWMANWAGLNLDWKRNELGPSPVDGTLDLEVAATWDKVVDLADRYGVYIQLVLQHHGQVSSQVNPEWERNPWNVANGGFLNNAAEFFTSPRALALTRAKYRFIVARWGYSPAIMAWELFNEVHWVDAIGNDSNKEAIVSQWHAEMAAYLRALDPYRHLITTSTENLRSAVYSGIDYLQPHNYAPDPIAGIRAFEIAPEDLSKPMFYGEAGDDHLAVSGEVKKTGVTIVPPIWASLMGPGLHPAQLWAGWDLVETERFAELEALARFAQAVSHIDRSALRGFSAVVETPRLQPFVLPSGFNWQRRPAADVEVPLDGREPDSFGQLPRIFMNAAQSPTRGYSSRVTLRFDLGRSTTFSLRVAPGPEGGSIRISVDGQAVLADTWPRPEKPDQKPPEDRDYEVKVSGGRHSVVIENPGDNGWFDLQRFSADADIPVLACIGRRNGDFLMGWLWHRGGVYSVASTSPEIGTVLLEDLPPGTWKITWWDTLAGKPADPVTIMHRGGTLRLATPPISRHAAFVAELQR